MIKVLIVEDEPLLLMFAVGLVEDAGLAITATNADDAIFRLEADLDIRVLWTDIDMPGSMDGLRLAATVRDRWPPVEIIVVSGMRRPLTGEMPARSVFFSKPYSQARVAETLVQMAV